MKNGFKDILKGNIVIVGVGNLLRSDDGFGPRFVEKIKEHVNAVCIDAGSAPENYVGKIVKLKPDTILIVDAVYLDSQPGKYEILQKSDINKSGFTTHNLSPAMFIGFLEKEIKAKIYILGVQPENTSFGERISDKLEKTLNNLSSLIIESLSMEKGHVRQKNN